MSALYTPDTVDTHLRAFPRDGDWRTVNIADVGTETLDGTGFSETWKCSNCEAVAVMNKTFTGAPREDDIDIVRGKNYFIGPNDHTGSRPGGQNITVKGGVDGVRFRGDFGNAVIGMYSNYDRWFALPRTRNITFGDDARGTVTLWWAEKPAGDVPSGVKVRCVPGFVVRAYFLWRSVQQSLKGK
jgi:hypothetical protein